MAIAFNQSVAPRRLDPASVIVSFALFMNAAFMIGEIIAYMGFGAHAGLPGIVAAAVVSALLTLVFRDRMTVPDTAAE